MFLVPEFEGGGVDLDYAIFDESLGPDQFIIRRVIDDIDDLGLLRDLQI